MTCKACQFCLAAIIVLALSGSLMAAAVIYEPFDYATGGIDGRDGGTGFAGAWDSTRNNPAIDTGNKDWGNLLTNGDHVRGAAWSSMIRPIGSTLSDAGLMDNGATLWFSVVLDLEGQNFTNADINVALGTDQFVSNDFGNRQNLLGDTAEGIGVTHSKGTIQGVYWQDTGVVAGVSERTVANTTRKLLADDFRALIVGKIEWGMDAAANETLTLYAPDLDLILGSPILDSWTTPALDQSQFDLVIVQFKDQSKIDEVRFGATFEDVTPQPKLTLQVDTTTGATTLLGDDFSPIDFKYYQITSDGDSLDKDGWLSLADQDYDGNGPPNGSGNGWEEAGGAGSHALSEAYLLVSSTIGAGASVSLGEGYNTAVNAQDLLFKYMTDTGTIVDGPIQYIASVIPGDFNGDGAVEAGDLALLLSNWGSSTQPGNWTTGWDGFVDANELADLLSNWGTGVSNPAPLDIAAIQTAIPEPVSLVLLIAGATGLGIRRNRKHAP